MVEIALGKHRFAALLRGGGDDVWDTPLLEGRDWIVGPTVGAIVPGWFLIIPRNKALNFREWTKLQSESPETLIANVQDHLGLSPDEVIWFEHGPQMSGTNVGCGLDYAHIHFLAHPPFTFSAFEHAAIESSQRKWEEFNCNSSYSEIGECESYLIAGSGKRTIFTRNVETIGSQFFRRTIAHLTGNDAVWDYRSHLLKDNILASINIFRSLESAARHGQ